MNSYNKSTNTDCFGNKGSSTVDHIWPTSNNGASSIENTQLLTSASNNAKGDKNSGKINNIRFSVTTTGKTNNGKEIGQMKILINKQWVLVKPTR